MNYQIFLGFHLLIFCGCCFDFCDVVDLIVNFIVQILSVCLLVEVGKGRGSRWYPYLVELPRGYYTLANFSQFEIQALQVILFLPF